VFDAALRAGARRHALTGGPAAALLAAGMVTAALLGSAAPAAAQPGGDVWYRLRVCESGNNYRTNTGNGFYGAYQFTSGTWRAYGGSGLPSNAPPGEQDYRAKLLYQARGWSPWPACSRRLGLRKHPSYGRTGAAPPRVAAHPAARPRASRPEHRPARRAVHRRPATTRLPHRTRPAVHRQTRLAVWSAPDGGRWGRSAAVLIAGTGHWTVVVRIPVATFRFPPQRHRAARGVRAVRPL
jgi:hypothetical protein